MENTSTSNSIVHSEEMAEIIGHPPSRLIRYGNIGFLAVFLLLFLTTYIVEYLDTIVGECTIYSNNNPKPVVSHTTGKLASLLISEGDTVKQNQTLAIIENTANYLEVEKLEHTCNILLTHIQENQWEKVLISPLEYKNLGEIQSSFQSFFIAYTQLNSFITKGLFKMKNNMLKNNILINDSLKRILLNQKNIHEKDLKIAENDYEIKKKLYNEKVIAKIELTQEESKLLAKKLPIQSVEASIMSNGSATIANEREKIDLESKYYEAKSNFVQALNKLSSDIQAWKQRYVIHSPIGGTATFSEIIQENQEIANNQTICYIEADNQNTYGLIKVGQNNFGKIAISQPVRIRLHSYPFQEYGLLEGRISNISHIPNSDKTYLIKVELKNGLITTRGSKINFTHELTADAEIIIKKTKLIKKMTSLVKGQLP